MGEVTCRQAGRQAARGEVGASWSWVERSGWGESKVWWGGFEV